MSGRARVAALAIAALLTAAAAIAHAASKPVPCFGAAARDPARPCENPRLDYSARPSPSFAPLELNSPCHPLPYTHVPRVCWFADRKRGSRETVALVGDSHASSWRSSLVVLARRMRWHALTLRRSSCPFNAARRSSPQQESQSCSQWVQATIRWFSKHPEIRTVFVTASDYSGFVTPPGQDPDAVAADGARSAMSALPATVQRVIVLRDTPRSSVQTLDCVEQAIRAHQPLAGACTLARSDVLPADPQAEAAQQLGGPRFSVIDLTDFFCDPERCFQVIGGALVFKDVSHMTTAFGTTLGPYLTSAYLRLP